MSGRRQKSITAGPVSAPYLGPYVVVDARTGVGTTLTLFSSRERAEAKIAEWTERDRRGGRPDLSDLIPHLVARPLRVRGADK